MTASSYINLILDAFCIFVATFSGRYRGQPSTGGFIVVYLCIPEMASGGSFSKRLVSLAIFLVG